MTKCKICGGRLKTWVKQLFDDRHGYPGYFDVYRCQKCGFGQTIPQLSKNQITKVYEKYYPYKEINIDHVKLEDYQTTDRFKLWRKGLFINGQYLVKPGAKVLDVGCGLGFSLLELTNIGCEAYGIDPNINGAKLAKKFKLKFHRGFIEDKPFGKIKFDYVIANQVLEHVNDPLRFLKDCKSRLFSGGKIIFASPNVDSWTRRILGKKWLHWHIPYHLNHFSCTSIEILAHKANLTIETIRTITPNMWTNLGIRRLLQKPQIGKRDYFWDGKRRHTQSTLFPRLLEKGYTFLEEYNLLNRFTDWLGWGESWVVTAKIQVE